MQPIMSLTQPASEKKATKRCYRSASDTDDLQQNSSEGDLPKRWRESGPEESENESQESSTDHEVKTEDDSESASEMEDTAEDEQIQDEPEVDQQNDNVFFAENMKLQDDVKRLKELLKIVNDERQKLHEDLMKKFSNIWTVGCIRSRARDEQEREMCSLHFCRNNHRIEFDNFEGASTSMHCDQICKESTTRGEMMDIFLPYVQSATDGRNVCVFVYGPQGSGKTYTMHGSAADEIDRGMVPRSIDYLFDRIAVNQEIGWEYEIVVSFIEIHEEKLYDLLSTESKTLLIRRLCLDDPKSIYVSNLTELPILDGLGFSELAQQAFSNRCASDDDDDEATSSSHFIVRIQLTGTYEGQVQRSTLNFVELAGSEESIASSSELINVIRAKKIRHTYAQYNNSPLTQLVMPHMTDNDKFLLVVNVAPFLDCFKQTKQALDAINPQ